MTVIDQNYVGNVGIFITSSVDHITGWVGGSGVRASASLSNEAPGIFTGVWAFAKVPGAAGNAIDFTFADTGVLGVSVVGTVITVNFDAGVSTRGQMLAAILGSAPAMALVDVVTDSTYEPSGAPFGAFPVTISLDNGSDGVDVPAVYIRKQDGIWRATDILLASSSYTGEAADARLGSYVVPLTIAHTDQLGDLDIRILAGDERDEAYKTFRVEVARSYTGGLPQVYVRDIDSGVVGTIQNGLMTEELYDDLHSEVANIGAAVDVVDSIVDAILVNTTAGAIAAAVWNALASAYNTASSMGAAAQSGGGGATAEEIVDELMAYSHDTGLTIRGAFRRMDALVAGAATGLRGTVARFFMRDGTTVAIQANQDRSGGTRATATVTGSES